MRPKIKLSTLLSAIASVALAFTIFAACPRASAQYIDIETNWNDSFGNCGAPGKAGCIYITHPNLCTGEYVGGLHFDSYTGQTNCDLDNLGSAEIPSWYSSLKQNHDVTFYVATDLHHSGDEGGGASYFQSWTHVQGINNFQGTPWPSNGTGIPLQGMARPAFVVTTGDDTHYGQADQLGSFRLLWEPGNVAEAIRYPVLMGLGNHDLDGQCAFNNCSYRMWDYLKTRMQTGTNWDEESHSFSFDVGRFHMVHLNVSPVDTYIGSNSDGSHYKSHGDALGWLIADLAVNVGKSGRPVILFHHYGWDNFSVGDKDPNQVWWSKTDRTSYLAILAAYNVAGIFSGHQHAPGAYVASERPNQRIDNFVGGSGGLSNNVNGAAVPTGTFYAVRTTDDFLDVAPVKWLNNGSNIQFSNLTGIGDADFHGGKFTLPGGVRGCRKYVGALPLLNVNPQVTVTVMRRYQANGFFYWDVQLTNKSTVGIAGPIDLGLTNMERISAGTNSPSTNGDNEDHFTYLVNSSFSDNCASFDYQQTAYRTNSYVDVPLVNGALLPGGSATVTLQFANSDPFNTAGVVVVTRGVIGAPTTVASSPAGQPLFVDGVPIVAPQSFVWSQGQAHFVAANPSANGNGKLINFNSWSDGGVATHLYIVPAVAGTITANFDVFYAVTGTTGGSGTVNLRSHSGAPMGNYYPAGILDITAKAMTGSYFSGYSGGVSGTSPSLTWNLSAPLTFKASFLPDPQTHIASGNSLVGTGTIDGGSANLPVTLAWTPGTSHTFSVAAQMATAPGARLIFKGWRDGATANPRSVVAGAGSVMYIADFTQQFQVSGTASPAGGGSVTGSGWYDASSSAVLSAVAGPGFAFTGFTGDIQAAASPQSIIVGKPVNVVANFVAASPRINVTASVLDDSGPAVRLNLVLNNSGAGTAAPLVIDTLTASVVSGSGTVVPVALPLVSPNSLAGSQQGNATVDLTWPATATRIQLQVHFTANGGAYTGAQTLTLFR